MTIALFFSIFEKMFEKQDFGKFIEVFELNTLRTVKKSKFLHLNIFLIRFSK